MLLAGGSTTIPRWTLAPVAGVASTRRAIPGDLAAALRAAGGRDGGPAQLGPAGRARQGARRAVRRAGGHDRLRSPGRAASRCPAGWRPVRARGGRCCWTPAGPSQQLLAHQHFGVGDLRPRAGPDRAAVRDRVRPGRGRRRRTGPRHRAGVAILPVRADGWCCGCATATDVLDADSAARISGYHRTALALIAADPDAEHGRQSLLSADELRYQIEGLAGPRRALPDRRFHELFEQRARRPPGRRRGQPRRRQWTYAGAQRPGQPAGARPAGAGAAPRRASSRW